MLAETVVMAITLLPARFFFHCTRRYGPIPECLRMRVPFRKTAIL